MAMLCLATGEDDLRKRLARTVVAWSDLGEPITVGDLGATGSAMALLRDALMPNLVQTVEGTPVLVHGGPFANIAHGCNSVLATRAALHLADWCVTEAGFAADLGAEKFFDIKCRTAGLDPAAVVIVTTARAMKYHGGTSLDALAKPDPAAVERGLANLAHHLELVARFGKPAVVALNGRAEDAPEEVAVIRAFCAARGARFAASTHYADGGAGALDLARAVMDAANEPSRPFTPLYDLSDRPVEKIRKIAKAAYGARDAVLAKGVATTLQGFAKRGWGNLPICMAKTPASLSDDPSVRGRPTNFDVTVQDVRVNTGAGFLVALLGDINRMPGLPKEPAAGGIDLVDGQIVGVG
jgi:formate--tetrahydrofolate ligase